MKLKELKFTDFDRKNMYDFILPIGSTEQHGPFLPFGTDTYITEYLINKVEKRFPKIVILPMLEYSRSQEHRGFYGSIWLSEGTLSSVLFDVCNSLKEHANHIYIVSFHANHRVIRHFIKNNIVNFKPVKMFYLEIFNDEDDKKIEKILNGPADAHAGNTEISNMLIINKSLVGIPSTEKKYVIKHPFSTDNIVEKSKNGIADNHPKWIVSERIGKRILDIYSSRIIHNLIKYQKK